MVLDDEPALLKLIQSYLEDEGFQVYLFSDASDCLEKVKKICPHLIILDLVMPALSGLAFLKKLREEDKELPVIILSAFTGDLTQDEMEAIRHYRVRDIISKSLDIKDSSFRIQKVLRDHYDF